MSDKNPNHNLYNKAIPTSEPDYLTMRVVDELADKFFDYAEKNELNRSELSRMIVAYEVWETENAEYSKRLIRKASLSQGIAAKDKPLLLHSDNGSPIKAATFIAPLDKLGVQSSFSRPRVSNDNPYSESLFKTMKYTNLS